MILNEISKKYVSEMNEPVVALNHVNIKFDSGFIILLGVSGTGKSTLLNIISGLDSASEGEFIIDDVDYTKLSQKEWDEYRLKNVGVVFQESNLISDLDVYDNLALPLKLLGMEQKEIDAEVKSVLDKVKLGGLIHRKVWQLSSGQRQRIAIARGIIKKPKVLILDEPTGNLDSKNSEIVFELLHELKSNCLIITATHDEVNANKYADRIITLNNGSVKDDKNNKINGNRVIDKISIKSQNDAVTYEVDGFDNKSIVSLVKNIISENQGGLNDSRIELDLNMEIVLKEDACQSDNWDNNGKDGFESRNKKTGLPPKEILKFAMNNLKTRKVRLALTVLLFMLSISLILISVNLFGYEYKDIMINYMNENQINYVPIHRNTTYRDIFDNKINGEILCGKKLIEDVSEFFTSNNVIRTIYLDYIYQDYGDMNECFDIPLLVGDFEEYHFSMIGGYPIEKNDIVISNQIAEKLFPEMDSYDLIDKKVNYDGLELNICGLIDDDQICIDEFERYGYILASNQLIELMDSHSDYIKLTASDLSLCNSLSLYISSKMKYGSLDDLEEKDLIWGQLPKEDNEIAVSKSLAVMLGYGTDADNSFDIVKLNLIDLEAERYNHAFDCINLYSYFKDGVSIACIYDTYAGDKIIEADALIQAEKYQLIKDLYYNYYMFDKVVVHIDDYKDFVCRCEKLNLEVDEAGCAYIYHFRDFIKNIHNLLIVFMIISILIGLFLLITFISYSIKDQSKKVGILRSLGVSMENILSIFGVEAAIITGFSIILGFLVSLFVLYQINAIYNNYMIDSVSFDIMEIKVLLYIVVCIVIYVMSYIALYLPLHKMSKQKPVDLIK